METGRGRTTTVELGDRLCDVVTGAWGVGADAGPVSGLESGAGLSLPRALSLAVPGWHGCRDAVLLVAAGLNDFIQGAVFRLLYL